MKGDVGGFPNSARRLILSRGVLLTALPVFLAGTIVILAIAYGTGGTLAWGSVEYDLLLVGGVALALCALVSASSVVHAPASIGLSQGSLTLAGLRWLSGRPHVVRLCLDLAAIESVGPTALGADEITGTATAMVGVGGERTARVPEHLYVSPNLREALGIGLTRGFAPWFRRAEKR